MRIFGFMVFHAMVMLLGITLVIGALFPVHAQKADYNDLTRRVESLESLQVDHRLTVIETKLDAVLSNSWVHIAGSGGIGLLLLKEAIQAVKKKVKAEEEG